MKQPRRKTWNIAEMTLSLAALILVATPSWASLPAWSITAQVIPGNSTCVSCGVEGDRQTAPTAGSPSLQEQLINVSSILNPSPILLNFPALPLPQGPTLDHLWSNAAPQFNPGIPVFIPHTQASVLADATSSGGAGVQMGALFPQFFGMAF